MVDNMTTTEEMPNEEGQVSFEEEGNTAVADVISDRIKTPEELIEHLQLDLSVWKVEKSIVNKWEIARRKDTKELVFEDGKITGEIKDRGDFTVEPLYQVKLWLIRIHPEPIEPVISPINISITRTGIPRSRATERKRCLQICDPHFGYKRDFNTGQLIPFHDRRALSIVLQVAETFLPDVTVWAGDMQDLADWTEKFVRSPDMFHCTQPALVECAWVMGQVAKYSQESVVLKGNHDKRMEDAISNHLSQAYFLRPANKLDSPPALSIPYLLGLDDMEVQYIDDYPSGKYYLNDDLALIHGDVARAAPGATAAAILDKSQISKGFGHIHRRELVSKTLWYHGKPKVLQAFCPGAVCKIDKTVPGATDENTWQQGIAMIEYDDEGFNVDFIAINEGSAYYRGKHFLAEDYRPHLYKLEYFQGMVEKESLLAD
jgi:hypothetical protein